MRKKGTSASSKVVKTIVELQQESDRIDDFNNFGLHIKDNKGNSFFILDSNGCTRMNGSCTLTTEYVYRQYAKK